MTLSSLEKKKFFGGSIPISRFFFQKKKMVRAVWCWRDRSLREHKMRLQVVMLPILYTSKRPQPCSHPTSPLRVAGQWTGLGKANRTCTRCPAQGCLLCLWIGPTAWGACPIETKGRTTQHRAEYLLPYVIGPCISLSLKIFFCSLKGTFFA